MKTSGTFKIALTSLMTHPFRAFLAALGVVFGVGAVVSMLAIGEGARLESIRQIEALGVDKLIVKTIIPESNNGERRGTKVGINSTNLRHIEKTFENIKHILPLTHWKVDVIGNGAARKTDILAVSDQFMNVTNSRLYDSRSRFITPEDNKSKNAVCVLGRRQAETIFQFRDPIGQRIQIGGAFFKVVGIIEHELNLTIEGATRIDNIIYIPMLTSDSTFGKPNRNGSSIEYNTVYLTVADTEQIENTSKRLQNYFRATHENEDYEIILPYELIKQQEATQRIFTIVMASIAAISLLVGGIGIMNIMLANIYERMQEIGTRRALGATKHDILKQFLMESVVLTSSGGCLGAVLGLGLAKAIQFYSEMPTEVTVTSVTLSFSISIVTGILFGTFPAWKAANLSPIVALRRE